MSIHLRTLSIAVLIVLPACSDDGVPAGESSITGSSEAGSASDATIDPTTQTTSAGTDSATFTGSASSDTMATDPGETTSPGDTTDPSGQDTMGPESSGEGTTTESPGTSGTGESSSTTDPTDSGSSSSDSGNGDTPVGDPCTMDSDCVTGVCWDFADYDPFCGGTACSDECQSDDDCIQLFTDAGAPFPEGALCGFDGRCDPVGSGLGAFFCQ